MAGLKRDELVYLNRMHRDYTQDLLPNQEQIRFDFGRLVGMIQRLTVEIDEFTKRDK